LHSTNLIGFQVAILLKVLKLLCHKFTLKMMQISTFTKLRSSVTVCLRKLYKCFIMVVIDLEVN